MIILRMFLVLISFIGSVYATPFESAQQFFKQGSETFYKHQGAFMIAGISGTVAAYVVHALYLDVLVNDKNSLWHWALHSIKDGIIDEDTLILFIQERYPHLIAIHPLTAIFAAIHDTQKEIDRCLALQGILKTLKIVRLEWLVSETSIRLDKKVESLYIFKMALSHCVLETRARCKKSLLHAIHKTMTGA